MVNLKSEQNLKLNSYLTLSNAVYDPKVYYDVYVLV